MKSILGVFLFLISSSVYAQVPADSLATPAPQKWRLKAIYGLNGTQTQFVNWNAGGRNNISALGFINGQANYKFKNIKWDNEFNISLGGLQYLDDDQSAETSMFQKTDDRLEYASNVGYAIRKDLNLSFISSFRTQMLDGFNYPNDSTRASTFMAPGYLNLGLGLDFTPNKNLTAFLSPAAVKMTFVLDDVLANQGAFGVEGATYAPQGGLITPGEQFRLEVGAYAKVNYNKNLAENIDVKTKLELFSNYLENPENIDVNAEVLWSFKVNSWFQASLQWNLIYDDDIRITDADGNTGPRTQFKSVLGLGISYTMKNYKETKK